ncbi:hypothetical protein B5G20_05110 [Collinsella sp. An7]|nr:hypothetical protein B5G20_05110 [Collinsella sp. An7]
MAYQNIKAELKRCGVSYAKVSELLDMSVNNVSLKMNERIPLTVSEAKKIRDAFFPDASLEYLLESDGDLPTEREERLSNLNAIEDVFDEVGVPPVFYKTLAEMRAEVEEGE